VKSHVFRSSFFCPISALVCATLLLGTTGCRSHAWRRGDFDARHRGLAPSVLEDDARNCSASGRKSADREGCVDGHTQHFSLAFVEFDDAGELWSIGDQRWDRPKNGEPTKWPKSQLENAVQIVQASRNFAQANNRQLLVLTFVHGWHNDASPHDEVAGQNLNSFKHSLEYLATHTQDQNDCTGDQCPVVVGIFLAWRGKLVQNDFLHVFTYANRRNAANRVGGVSMTEAIMLLELAAKGAPAPYDMENHCQQISQAELESHRIASGENPNSVQQAPPPAQFFLVGHSFGARALLHGTAQAVLALILEQKAQAVACAERWAKLHPDQPLQGVTITSPIDLIALINPADDALATKSLIEAFKRDGIRARDVNHALFLSIKADRDSATGWIMGVGQTISGGGPRMHAYDRGVKHDGVKVSKDNPPPYPSACEQGQLGLKTQPYYYRRSAPGIYNMASHLVAYTDGVKTLQGCLASPVVYPDETFVWSPASADTPETSEAPCLSVIPVKDILDIDNGAYSSDSKPFSVSPQQFYSCQPKYVDGDHTYVGPWNDTPFFVMHAPRELMQGHDDIFRKGILNLLVQLTAVSQGPTVLNIRLTPRTMPNKDVAPLTKQ
jgi:hypothetical protein